MKHRDWCKSPIDAFILARLEQAGLSPSPPADRRTLIRRASLRPARTAADGRGGRGVRARPPRRAFAAWSTGCSPRPATASAGDGTGWTSPATPTPRTASSCSATTGFARYAYTYRDYVVRAFNEDLPFDRFVQEQLAADRRRAQDEPWRLAAMGFLTLGRLFDNNMHDQIDDRIDTVTRGLLGLTVSCARCHDHKYDADPHGRLLLALRRLRQQRGAHRASPDRPVRRSAPAAPGSRSRPTAKRAELRQVPRRPVRDALRSGSAVRMGDYLVRAATPSPTRWRRLSFSSHWPPMTCGRRSSHAGGRYSRSELRPDDPVFGPWHDLMTLADAEFAADASADRGSLVERPSGTCNAGSSTRSVRRGPAPDWAQDQGRRPPLWRAASVEFTEASKTAPRPRRSEDCPTGASTSSSSHESPAYFPQEPDLLLHVARREGRASAASWSGSIAWR